ncbi:MAG: response regulator [Spirochaetaceae bacterium]
MIQILLVDDEEFSLQGMKKLIPWEQWKCEIAAVADSGKKALEIINSTHIDIVFTDIKMPKMDGLQLIKEIRNNNNKIKFVIISGYSEFDYAQKAIKYGVKKYLLKPVGIAEIEETLLSLTENIISNGLKPKNIKIDIEPIVKEILISVTQKNWNKISEILLSFFKEISAQGGSLDQSRKLAIKILSSLVKNEVIFSNDSTFLLAGEIGSAKSQSGIYNILKDQVMITQNQNTSSISKKTNPNIQKILIYLLTHYKDKNLTLKWLSENVTYVKSDYLGKLFFSETGKKFATYLNEYRVTRACEYLRDDSHIAIHELAEMVGYDENVSYFIRQFKTHTGMTPMEFLSSTIVTN